MTVLNTDYSIAPLLHSRIVSDPLMHVLIIMILLVSKLQPIRKRLEGLLANLFSFTSFSYKVGLIRTLVDRAYKINNSLLSFNNDAKKLTLIFKRNQSPEYVIKRVVKRILTIMVILPPHLHIRDPMR